MPNLDKAIAGTVVWVDLATPELDKARAFYGELLGWSYVGGDDARMGFYTTAQRGGRRIAALWKKGPETPGPSAWCIYFGSDDADETARKVTAAGGQVIAAPMDVMEYGRMAIFSDPTGAVFGVWQSKQHTGAQVVNETGAMAWHEVYTRDANKAREFYARVFGLEQRRLEDAKIEYWTLHQGPTTVCGLMQMTDQFPKEVPSHWNTYFAVDDTDAATAKLQQLGGKVFQPAFDTPYGRMSAVADPVGAGFCLIKPSNPG
jgi:predicted enzyme related to lactoylglutathione lyase